MAQVFELHFNPKLKEDLIFDSFCYEPTNVYEKRLGSLYLTGELKNVLPQNLRFLDHLTQVIKGKFYATPIKSIEENLKAGLKKANDFLEEEVKNDNTSWLGNLNFAVLSLKNFDLNFTKVGNLKIFLLRGGEIIDLGKKLELQEIEPYPLKIFLNIVSGKLTTDDIIFVSTKEIFDLFLDENFLAEITKSQIEKKFSEKELKRILQSKEKVLAGISGVCLLISLKEEVLPKKAISFEKEVKIIPLKKFFQPLFNQIKNFPKILQRLVPQRPKIKIRPKIEVKKFLPKLFALPKIQITKELKKKLILILALILLLAIGFLVFQRKREVSLKEKEKIVWENLAKESKLKIIENPEIYFEFSKEEFLPQKMTGLDNTFYFLNPNYNWFFKFENGKKEKIEAKEKIKMGASFAKNSILSLSEKNQLTLFENDLLKETFSLKEPYPEFEIDDFSVFKQNLYFLDSRKGEILKYSFPPNTSKFWLSSETKKVINAKSIAIDGSVWILTDDNKIDRYFAGKYQETLTLNIFPEPKNFEKIFTSFDLPYLFILEPAQKRVIVLEKTGSTGSPQAGEVFAQFQSEKFDDLKDFFVSDKIIYLLNGQKVYWIEI
ncbi:MAG: hypothetical protein COY72_01620 [Candidatus Nealsonbacteria bacterium CG_4_10_14_0_8_um_filter_35_10]|uniref:Uncharacterized protein n=2 Tax=Candidatus Nealsoniibacteriota TaxID=1817911 RepID=A0A2M7R884_9BACT|nr:MAG: hypothetical protein AUJ24_01025 [Parcubacteria group bacterium CG1_02_36_42]PIY90788.1 MAG: hypothetical protein COY72_01620 [Candidatus Nealsonbacteria bacterium CG_4_10_14_0_8_um_filter_35_10]PJB99448.1 MAG: hypothetical protein CO077_01655 [Candidatus Nealsonbacteria bacterium CG_4_9_14_0_8_um_filter_35_12]